jgi:sporulation protein YlmC with PRC-barrel domain
MSEHHLDIVRQVLDNQVVDKNHVHCGKVDDILIDIDGDPKVTGIIIGNGAESSRLPELARWISRKLFGTQQVKIPWEDVLVITEVVKLAKDAKDYGLDERKGWTYNLISRLPGAWKK